MKGALLTAAAVSIALVFLVAPARAGNADVGTISYVHFISNGVVIFYTSGARSNVPACAVLSSRFAFNGTTPAGKLQTAGLLAAYAQGKQIAVVGTGNCVDWGDTESVSFFYTVG